MNRSGILLTFFLLMKVHLFYAQSIKPLVLGFKKEQLKLSDTVKHEKKNNFFILNSVSSDSVYIVKEYPADFSYLDNIYQIKFDRNSRPVLIKIIDKREAVDGGGSVMIEYEYDGDGRIIRSAKFNKRLCGWRKKPYEIVLINYIERKKTSIYKEEMLEYFYDEKGYTTETINYKKVRGKWKKIKKDTW